MNMEHQSWWMVQNSKRRRNHIKEEGLEMNCEVFVGLPWRFGCYRAVRNRGPSSDLVVPVHQARARSPQLL